MHEQLMRQLIEAASHTSPHPNPRVGAAVVDSSGEVVGEGVHAGPGYPHAEVIALENAGPAAVGRTLVTSLEPCDHHGHTPPCTEAIIDAGITRVVIGAIDPDPQVDGSGLDRLRSAGIEVETGLLAGEVETMDPAYFHHRRTGRPRVTLKLALTLDGQIAAADGSSQWITSPEAREDAHSLRGQADAVIVGAGTVRRDDPGLDVRLTHFSRPQPTPVIIAGAAPLPQAKVLERNPIVVTPHPLSELKPTLVMPGPNGVDLDKALLSLGDMGLLELLVEGGAGLAGSLIDHDLVDRFVFYYGAKLANGIGLGASRRVFGTFLDALDVEITEVTTLGPDIKVEFRRRR